MYWRKIVFKLGAIYESLIKENILKLKKLKEKLRMTHLYNMNCNEEHLGGYIKASPVKTLIGLNVQNGDPLTYSPILWRWVYDQLSIKSVLDVGCGEGHCAAFFKNLGCNVLGIDGSIQAKKDSVIPQEHIIHDFQNGPYEPGVQFDLVWSCEFVEHVEEQYLQNFLATFSASCKYIMLTYAPPGQPGWHHVNCQPQSYWVAKLADTNFTFQADLTKQLREIAELGHFRSKGLVFLRDK